MGIIFEFWVLFLSSLVSKQCSSSFPTQSRAESSGNYLKQSALDPNRPKLNENILTEIADRGNGNYIDGSNTENAVEFIKEELNRMDKTEFEAKQFAEYKDQFQWFLAAGFLFLFLDIFVLDRKTQWLKKLNLFNEHDDEQD